MAKQLCDSKQLDYVYKNLGEDYSQDQFFAQFPTARTFPQIIFNGEAIGGFDNLRMKI